MNTPFRGDDKQVFHFVVKNGFFAYFIHYLWDLMSLPTQKIRNNACLCRRRWLLVFVTRGTHSDFVYLCSKPLTYIVAAQKNMIKIQDRSGDVKHNLQISEHTKIPILYLYSWPKLTVYIIANLKKIYRHVIPDQRRRQTQLTNLVILWNYRFTYLFTFIFTTSNAVTSPLSQSTNSSQTTPNSKVLCQIVNTKFSALEGTNLKASKFVP
jgi:hypothetical protein